MHDFGERTVAIAGLGAIGAQIAAALDRGIEGLRLIAVSARDVQRAGALVADFVNPPAIVSLAELAAADIVIEATPAPVFEEVAVPAIAAGRMLIPCSVGALLSRLDLIDEARRTGARIIVPTGAIAGLDSIRALAESAISTVRIESHKPPRSLAGAPYLLREGVILSEDDAMLVFEGNAIEAALAFPANINVAAALALAGIGSERTKVEIWSDPGLTRNAHKIFVESAAAKLSITIEDLAPTSNPKTAQLAGLSVIACLRGLTSTLKVGS